MREEEGWSFLFEKIVYDNKETNCANVNGEMRKRSAHNSWNMEFATNYDNEAGIPITCKKAE